MWWYPHRPRHGLGTMSEQMASSSISCGIDLSLAPLVMRLSRCCDLCVIGGLRRLGLVVWHGNSPSQFDSVAMPMLRLRLAAGRCAYGNGNLPSQFDSVGDGAPPGCNTKGSAAARQFLSGVA